MLARARASPQTLSTVFAHCFYPACPPLQVFLSVFQGLGFEDPDGEHPIRKRSGTVSWVLRDESGTTHSQYSQVIKSDWVFAHEKRKKNNRRSNKEDKNCNTQPQLRLRLNKPPVALLVTVKSQSVAEDACQPTNTGIVNCF